MRLIILRTRLSSKIPLTAIEFSIINECVERGVGTLVVGWPEDVRSDDLGRTANKWLHTWAFDRLYQYLNYKGEAHGIEVLKENEWNTSKTCCECGDITDSNRVERVRFLRTGSQRRLQWRREY